MFNVGDKVLIITDTIPGTYIKILPNTQGRITKKAAHIPRPSSSFYEYRVSYDDQSWWFRENCLEPAPPAPFDMIETATTLEEIERAKEIMENLK
jgi:hypothetical protein